jgi:hypothetical protein
MPTTPVTPSAPSKPIYQSKTFWFNVLSVIVTVAGVVPVTPVTMGIAAVGNVILRIVTNQPVTIPGVSSAPKTS